jgi:hypothetical protein
MSFRFRVTHPMGPGPGLTRFEAPVALGIDQEMPHQDVFDV